jgi:hypothetical protein
MAKAKAQPEQLPFDFTVPAPPAPKTAPAALAGLEQRVSETVGTMLASDGRRREVIAAEMTVLAGEEISRWMLDAYSAPSRDTHNISFARMIVLATVTNRQDLLDPIMREGGMAVLVGEEVITAELGHIDREIEQLKSRRREIAGSASPIRSGGIDGQSRRRS